MQHMPFLVVSAVILTIGGCYAAASRPNGQAGPSVELLIAPGESVRGPLRLNASTRDQHIQRCASSDMVSGSDDTAKRFCDCLINRLEDRANKLEFALIMAAIMARRPTGSLSDRLVPASEGRGPKYLREAAIADGFTNVGYTEVVMSVPAVAYAAARHCGN
jgi:hypothetical protein